MNKETETGWMSISRNSKAAILALVALAVLFATTALIPAADSEPGPGDILWNGRISQIYVEDHNLPHGEEGDIYWTISGDTLYVDAIKELEFAEMDDFYGHFDAIHDRPNWEFVDGWLNVKNVILTKAVTSIGDDAFCGPDSYFDHTSFDGYQGDSIDLTRCTNLTRVGDEAFYETTIKHIDFPASVTTVGEDCFFAANCEYIWFHGQNVTEVERNAFYSCRIFSPFAYLAGISDTGEHHSTEGYSGDLHYYFDLNTLHIEPKDHSPVRMPDYDDEGAPWCSFAWFKEFDVVIADGVENIGDYGLAYNGIGALTIPDSVKTIGAYAFTLADIKSISALKIADIDGTAFYMGGLTSLDMHESPITAISDDMFYQCVYLKSIVLPAHLETIGARAFYDCGSLTTITFPETLESISEEAFLGCRELKYISYGPTKPLQQIGNSAFELNYYEEHQVHCTVLSVGNVANGLFDDYRGDYPDLTVFDYLENTADGNIQWDFKDSVLYLDKSASASDGTMRDYSQTDRPLWETSGIMKDVNRIVIGSGITSIGAYAFYGLDMPIEIQNSRALTKIGESAFEGCINLQEMLKIHTNIYIGDRAFAGCTNVYDVLMYGDSWDFEYVGEHAFDLGEGKYHMVHSQKNIASEHMPYRGRIVGDTWFDYIRWTPIDSIEEDDSGDSDALVKGISAVAVLVVTAVFIAFVARKD
jgi:hypothetical protein